MVSFIACSSSTQLRHKNGCLSLNSLFTLDIVRGLNNTIAIEERGRCKSTVALKGSHHSKMGPRHYDGVQVRG